METNSDADAPRPDTPDQPPAAPPTEADSEAMGAAPDAADELSEIVAAAEQGRLSASQEDRATALLKEELQGGRMGVARVVAALPRLPWLVGIRAVETVWPELTAGFRTQLLSGLAKDETEAARRVRLSMARALFKIDPPVGLKIAVGVAKEMLDKDTGAVAAKDAQMYSNVFIGRARPWIALLPLAELKPAEADLLVHVTVLVAFTQPHPPVTQLSILKWVQTCGRLDKLEEPAQAAVLAGIGRWSAKWQNALRKEVPELPEAILAVLKPETPDEAEAAAAESGESDATEDAAASEEGAEAAPRRERPVYISREEEARRKAILEGGGTLEPEEPAAQAADEEDEDEDEEDAEREPEREPRGARGPRDYREPREPRESRGGRGSFNVSQALRQIESHVNALRSELETAKTRLRSRDKDALRTARKPDVPVIEGEPTPEELARLNHQFELRNAELQARIDELTQHAEDVAAASGALSDQPVSGPDAQLRALLALKLQEDYADFRALENEGNDVVVQQHYRTLIGHIFEVLLAQGVPLTAGES